MTRINTNVSSLNAQKTLARSNAELQQALTRLSTGLRINSGKDDPAGLIASEMLRSDMISTQTAITNSERASQMIATADSALGQVSSLLNDIRGLISEAANEGAMSQEQIDANQLQVDSSLEAIDRISQVTQFQGKRLLDGSLDFITAGVNSSQLTGVQLDQANVGPQNQIDVSVKVETQATKAQLTYNGNVLASDVVLEVGGSKGFEAFSFGAGSTVADMKTAINLVSDALGITAEIDYVIATADSTGTIELSSVGADNDVNVTALTTGRDGGNIAFKYSLGGSATTTSAVYTAANATTGTPATVAVSLAAEQWDTAAAVGGNRINLGGTNNLLAITAKVAGAQFNNTKLVLINDAVAANGATYDYQNQILTVTENLGGPNYAATAIAALINRDLGPLFDTTGTVSDAGDADVVGEVANIFAGHLGNTGGIINANGDAVVSALNATAAPTDPGNYVLATGGGTGTVTLLSDYAYLGTMNTGSVGDTNNYIQLVGPSLNNLPISMVNNGASKNLSIDFEENRITGGYAQAVIQGAAANASFKITAKNRGTEYDNVDVRFYDLDIANHAGYAAGVAWNPHASSGYGELAIYADFAGGIDADNVVALINNDVYISSLFTAEVYGANGSGNVASPGAGANASVGTLVGGKLYDAVRIQLATDANGVVTTTANDLIDYINNASAEMKALGISASNAGSSDGTGTMAVQSTSFATVGVTTYNAFAQGTTNAQSGVNGQIRIKAMNAGSAYEGVKVIYRANTSGLQTDVSINFDSASKELNVYIANGVTTAADVLNAFTAANNPTEYYLFQMEAVGNGAGVVRLTDGGTLTGGTSSAGTSLGVAMVGNWDEGDILGTEGLHFLAQNYGSDKFVSVKAIQGTFTTVNTAGTVSTRENGTDVVARINGIQAIGKGLQATINTSALDLSVWVDEDVVDNTTSTFTITGGGAQFQLGPDVVSNQQARMGIASVSTATLGGNSGEGRLFQIRSGNPYSLSNNTAQAAKIVESVITQITSLRGRLGAFQKTTLQTNIDALNDTLEALTEAESSIRDADFAAESAALTRAQILVQSGISVLSIANQNPQAVLSLLR